MSTGLNYLLVERKAGEWYYVLEDSDAPKQCWDWREYATAYGPFPTEDAADEHRQDNFANPGGSQTITAADYREDAVLAKLIKDAPAAKRELNNCRGFFGRTRRVIYFG